MKKIIRRNKLKILIPLGLFFAVSASTAGFLFSPRGQEVIYPQSLQAGYDQISGQVIYKNKYQPTIDSDINASALKISSQPDFRKEQSLDFTSDQYSLTTNTYKQQVEVKNVASGTASTKPVFNQVVWAAKMTKQQFENMFRMKQEPQIGVKFDVKFSAWNESTNKNETVTFNNSITGFALSDLVNLKNRSYLVFNHAINDDFSSLLGRLTANLDVAVDILGNYTMSLSVQAFGIVTNQLSTTASKNYFEFDFNPNQKAPSILTLWNVNGFNDIKQYLWKPPAGPVVNPDIVLPRIDSRVISPNQYRTSRIAYPGSTSSTYDAKTRLFGFAYKKVANVSATNGENATWNNFYVINMTQAQWQRELYTQYSSLQNSGIANPGLKVQFNLKLNLISAEHGELQEYNPTLYGYVQMGDLIGGRNFSQVISDYDLSAGRKNNNGNFKINLDAKVNLDKSLTLKLWVRGQNLGYWASKTTNPALRARDYRFGFDLDNLTLSSYFNKQGAKIKPGEVLPNTNFNTDLSQANISTKIANANVKGEYPNARGNGKQFNRNSKDPYLFLYNTVWSRVGTFDLKPYVESNSTYANKSLLTFNFSGLAEFDNTLRILNHTRKSNMEQTVQYNEGSQTPTSKYPTKEVHGKNITNIQDNGNRFKVYVSEITTSDTNFTWKTMYTYFSGNYRYKNQWDRTLEFNRNWPYQSSLMRMRFYLSLRKSSDNFTISYKLGVSAASYQWFWARTWINKAEVDGPQAGKGGFKLGSIGLQVNV